MSWQNWTLTVIVTTSAVFMSAIQVAMVTLAVTG